MRLLYALIGGIVGATVDLAVNLLAAVIQQQPYGAQLGEQSIWVLVAVIIIGIVVAYWLSGRIDVPAAPVTAKRTTQSAKTTSMTRLRALLSYIELRGRGIHLADILLIGSKVKIDSGE